MRFTSTALIISIVSLFLAVFSPAQAQTNNTGSTGELMGFARSVAVSGGSVFIGEPANVHKPGLVYLFRQSDSGWSQQAVLEGSQGLIDDGFGSALSAGGARVLIGAPGSSNNLGAAYIFERSADGSWAETARIAYPDTSAGTDFGGSVNLAGNMAFIGAPDAQDGMGAVYIFGRSNDGSWAQQARLANPDTARGTNFGSALAVEGTRLMVGAPDDNGTVYVYQKDNMGSWNHASTITSGQASEGAEFGSNLALHGDRVLVAAPDQSSGAGAVFTFRRNSETGEWAETGRLMAYDSEPRFDFGASLALTGNNAWVGAPGADDDRGALYRFEWDADAMDWAGVKKVDGPDRSGEVEFASTFAIEGNLAVAGMIGADYGAGTAAILEREGQTDAWTPVQTILGKSRTVLESITGNKVDCSDGQASIFGCKNVDLLSFLPIDAIGGDRGVRLNDMWGWTDPKTGKEYALVGRNEGTSFVDVSNPGQPVYVGTLPMPEQAEASVWRDIKVYDNHAFIVADNAGRHGMQVVDLAELRNYEGTPIHMEEVAHYNGIHSAHNIVINTDTGFAYIVGSSGGGNTCGGGLHMVNIQDPANPQFVGCFADPSTGRSGTGYSHDAQCVTYHGPDKEYQGREICIGANETAISIADVTDKQNPKAVSTASYPDYGYVHQGWLTEDHRYFFQNDELDELSGTAEQTRTLVWDLQDLDDPQFVREYFVDNPASDHNLYIKDGIMYQSNYVSGLQVIDVSNPANPVKKGYFDTAPFGEDTPGFAGTWSNFPFFDSGIVVMTSGREGLFILDYNEQEQEL